MRFLHQQIYDHEGDGLWGYTVDDGFSEYMYAIYRYMTLGLLLSGAIAYLCAHSALYRILAMEPLIALPLLVPPLAFVVVISRRLDEISPEHAKGYFWLFAALIGASFAGFFQIYWGEGIANAFFETAGAFFVLSMVGFFTKRTMTPFGTFLLLTLTGCGLAAAVDYWSPRPTLQDPWLASLVRHDVDLLTTAAGIMIFAGLTAWDTPTIKARFYRVRSDDDLRHPKPSVGALNLYLDFINRFLALLHITPRPPSI